MDFQELKLQEHEEIELRIRKQEAIFEKANQAIAKARLINLFLKMNLLEIRLNKIVKIPMIFR